MAKHFLTILDMSKAEAAEVIHRARQMKERDHRSDLLSGRTMILIFEKASTRTRISFEVAVRHLGGATVFMTPAESQLGRSEPLRDTARVISRYAQGMIVRTFGQDKLEELRRHAGISVVNALSDDYHPCQVMSDLLTIHERTPDFHNLRVAWVGDGNNMAQSWINASAYFPFTLALAVPKGFEPRQDVLNRALKMGARVEVTHDPAEAVRGAHYVNTDVWASMGQESEQEARLKPFSGFQVNRDLLMNAHPDCRVLHCLPAHRGEEITDEIMESPTFKGWDQAENRLHMQKAILEWIYR